VRYDDFPKLLRELFGFSVKLMLECPGLFAFCEFDASVLAFDGSGDFGEIVL